MRNLASAEYQALLQQRYSRSGWGGSGKSHIPEVMKFSCELGSMTILDYGCGRGTLKAALLDIGWKFPDVREYDPGIVGKDVLPDPADLVVCTDVLEHIEPELLHHVFNHLSSLAIMGMYITIGLGPAREVLDDGRNAHLIQQPPDWWLKQLREAGFPILKSELRKGLNVWVKR